MANSANRSGVCCNSAANPGRRSSKWAPTSAPTPSALRRRLEQPVQVIAIEPQPVIFQTLCANLALNALTHVDAIQCGCGRSRQTLSIPRFDYAREENFGGVSLQAPDPGNPSIPIA